MFLLGFDVNLPNGLHHNRPGSVFYPPEKMVYLGIIFRFATQKHRPVSVAGEDESVHKSTRSRTTVL